ncbi:fatty acyl-CoA reductase 1-like [Armigeres subalbatus]|uniref:fatty acyl-CoA reductase 1-like n=1 Tax=Armigeres subalbatus TaxID=124917 RepID=UPI002ED3CD64
MFCYPQSNKVLDFYEGATILIVGGTGFVGKALLEKVLRCLKVKKVYLLIRSKDGHCAKDRLGKLMEDQLFDQVRDQVNKVEAVQVDFDVECFGLDNVIAETVQREVEVVFYCLADVKFNRPLKEAFQTNVQIGKYLLRWCRGFPNLKSIVYTSTFYSECTKNFVEEKVSEDVPFGDYKLCMKMLTTLSSDECEKIKVDLLGDYPNTYTFTKKLAEIMIQKEFVKDLPIGVYRPSAVSPSYQEPQPGWTDNFYGIAAIIRASIDGINQVVLSDLNQAGNYVPLDYCVNAILVGGFDISQRKSSCCKSEPTVTVYNHVSKVNKCSYGDVIRYSAESRPRFWERLAW